MQVEIGPRSVQDMIDGVARRAEKIDAIERVKESADALADANRTHIIVSTMAHHQNVNAERAVQGKPPLEVPRTLKDTPTNTKFFRRLAGLRNGDLK